MSIGAVEGWYTDSGVLLQSLSNVSIRQQAANNHYQVGYEGGKVWTIIRSHSLSISMLSW